MGEFVYPKRGRMNNLKNNQELRKTVLSSLTNDQGYTILLLGAIEFEPVKGKLWYQKEMFFVSRDIEPLKTTLDFEPYFIGPHSKRLEEVLNQLEFYHVIQFDRNKIQLTNFGKEIFEEIKNKRPKDELDFLSEIKKLLNDLTNDELLLFVYSSIDPIFITESVEYKRVMQNKENIAINLYKKEKITLAKSAELAKTTIEDMMRMLKIRNLIIH
jgi:hypothetical protein